MVSEWNLKLNHPNTVENLTMGQKRMIGLAERAEAYVKRESRKQSQSSTQTNLENRQSKQKRINEAIAEHST